MSTVKGIASDRKALVRRYLIWCYKTTKEDLDRIDRYYTQLMVDEKVLKRLRDGLAPEEQSPDNPYFKKVAEFAQYMKAKEERVNAQKYEDVAKQIPKPEYRYLKNRLAALEEVIEEILGADDLASIRQLYEEEMTRRILEAREH